MTDTNLREWVEEFNHWKAVAESKQALRDTFAAAALTGFASQLRYGSVFNLTLTAKQCYELADAMLHEREQANHDAVPAAIAVSDEDRTDKAATSHRRDRSGNTPVTEPMPVVVSGSGSVTPVSYAENTARRVNWHTNRDTTEPRNGAVSGPDLDSRVWETQGHTPPQHPTPGECSTQREGTSEPVAWAVVPRPGDEIDCEFVYADEATAGDVALGCHGCVVPLYRDERTQS